MWDAAEVPVMARRGAPVPGGEPERHPKTSNTLKPLALPKAWMAQDESPAAGSGEKAIRERAEGNRRSPAGQKGSPVRSHSFLSSDGQE